jgi:hypothetical protein
MYSRDAEAKPERTRKARMSAMRSARAANVP